MNNAERYSFADFTHKNYRYLLLLGKAHYAFRSFQDFSRSERFIIMRHDIDFSLGPACQLAQMEANLGIRTTYFLHLHNRFYNLLDDENTSLVREILSLGHHVGLHFDCDYYGIRNENDLKKWLDREKTFLEKTFSEEIACFSFHNPGPASMAFWKSKYSGMTNTYSKYFRSQVSYCSDSNGYWRYQRLEDIFRDGRASRIQVLIHPLWWPKRVMSPKERIRQCIEETADRTGRWYDRLLRAAGRKNIDWK